MMIAPLNLSLPSAAVAHKRGRFVRMTDLLRGEAAAEIAAALEGVSGKRVERAGVPGANRTGLSRAMNGSTTNPLWRIATFFLLLKRLGLGRERAQRLVDWLQELVDVIWGEDDPPLEEVLEHEQELDVLDEPPQQRVGRNPNAPSQMLAAKMLQHAYDRVVIRVLRREVEKAQA